MIGQFSKLSITPHIAPPPLQHLCSSSSSVSSSSRSRSRSRSLRVSARLCSFHSLDVLAVIDCDPAAGGERKPVDERNGDEGDDEEGDDYENGFHAERGRGWC